MWINDALCRFIERLHHRCVGSRPPPHQADLPQSFRDAYHRHMNNVMAAEKAHRDLRQSADALGDLVEHMHEAKP